jgi:outer membrane protein TolC
MISNNATSWFMWIMSVSACCLLAGCAEHDYKAEADRDAYQIIDEKWQADFGSKANFKISDTEPSPDDIQPIQTPANLGKLTLPQAVALATAQNRQYQSQREALYLQALDLRLTRHQFENLFFGGGNLGYSGNSDHDVLGAEANAGFNRLLANGTRISAKIGLAWADILSGNLRGGLASILGATVVMPLLRGSQREIVLEGLTQAERDTLYQIRSFNRFRKTFVVEVITEYYSILLWQDWAQNAQQNRSSLIAFYEHCQKLVQAGLLPKLELQRIHQEGIQAYNRHLQRQRIYEEALDRFKITLSLKPTHQCQVDFQVLQDLKAAGMGYPDFSEDDVIDAALSRRLDLANVSDQVIDAQRKVAVAEDQLRAELNIVANTGLTSAKDADWTRLQARDNEYGVGLDLDLPFDRMMEATEYRKAQIALNQRKREYEQHSSEITLAIREAYRKLVEAAERYRIQAEALELALKRQRDTMILLKHRRVSTRRVLQALADLLDAQDAGTKALVDFTVATLAFYRDTGVLNIQPDGMWKL